MLCGPRPFGAKDDCYIEVIARVTELVNVIHDEAID